jgi:cell division protein FtsZ
MFEIQEAAKIITESVDPNARIIFGTVRSDKLKKGEIKITVIASSFPESNIRKGASLFQSAPNDEEKGRGTIFNSFSSGSKDEEKDKKEDKKEEPTIEKKKNFSTPAPTKVIDDKDDDDWSAVPAFLRRSKLK